MHKIALYTDYVHNNDMLAKRLADAMPGPFEIKRICAEQILSEKALDNTHLLVVPGGADLYYCEKLNGAGNKAIRDFIYSGGRYLGICAGAYYGAKSIIWAEMDQAHIIQGARELALIDTTAKGPMPEFMQGDMNASWDGVCALNMFDGDVLNAIYRGGCWFDGLADDNHINILAWYDRSGKRPAIISRPFGKGRVVSSGPHIELRGQDYRRLIYRHRNPNYAYQKDIPAKVEQDDNRLDQFWTDLVRQLLIRA